MENTSLILDSKPSAEDLWLSYQNLINESKGLRIRDAAQQLQVSEADLLACQIPQGKVTRLHIPQPAELLNKLPELGRVMALTRNKASVLENKGVINPTQIVHPGVGIVEGPIELRLFLTHWKNAFAVESVSRGEALFSIQVFDASGNAVFKVFLQKESDFDAYNNIITAFKAEDQSPEQITLPAMAQRYSENFDKEALLQDWGQLKDTHDFFMLLRKHQVSRLQATQAAENTFTYSIPNLETVLEALRQSAAAQFEIMLFVGNPGCIQIHQDLIHNVVVKDSWYNVMDENLNLHLDTSLIQSAWLVKKPTTEGIVTSIELFDDTTELSLQIFSYRKLGVPENPQWPALCQKLVPHAYTNK